MRAGAFTLVELILVMALLCIIVGIAVPSLSRSMHQRNLVQEAERLLALTEYARDEAASRGVPMVVWIDTESGQYGVKAKTGYEDSGMREKQFTLPGGVRFEALAATSGTAGETGTPEKDAPGEADAAEYAPDGTLDPTSQASVMLVDQSNSEVGIEQARDANSYEIIKDAK